MLPNSRMKRTVGGQQRQRGPARAQVACVNCKERKLKCDDQTPACANCVRNNIACLVEDLVTKRQLPRNYLETLEKRVAQLESLISQSNIDAGSPAGQEPQPVSITNASSPVLEIRALQDEDTNLASKVGMLDLNAAGAEPHYLGSSSAFAFSRLINSSLRQVIPWRPAAVFGLTKEATSPLSPCPLPDYNTCIALSNAYFLNIHIQYPFFHEPTFRQWEAKIHGSTEAGNPLGPENSIPLFFLNMVYSIGALLFPHLESLSQQLYISAQLYIDDVLARDNLESIQAILCCAMYSLRSRTGPSLWRLTGLVLCQSIEFGYHRSSVRRSSIPNILRLELQRRSFWCAYSIHCMAAIKVGRPLLLSPRDIDAEFPMDIDDSMISEAGCTGTPRTTQEEPLTNMSVALHVYRLRCIWARILTSLYSDTVLSDSENSTYGSRVHQLRCDLDDWIASAPPVSPRDNALTIFATEDWFQTNYSYTILLLYRSQLASGKDTANEVVIRCLRAAESICHGYRRQYIGTQVNYTWAALHVLFMAGLTYVHCLWESPAARAAVRYDEVSNTCTDCAIVFAVMGKEWNGAAPYRDIFEVLSKRTLTMMVDKDEAWWKTPPPSTLANCLDPSRLTQWQAEIVDTGMLDETNKLLTDLIGDVTSQAQEDSSHAGGLPSF